MIVRYLRIVSLTICFVGFLFCDNISAKDDPHSFTSIEQGFKTPPDSVRIAVYWYWMSDNISVKGVERDLEAMKKAGITRAQIGIIGGEGVPQGKVLVFSPQWWKVLHAALKKASELDIEIGMFNCPGWSQSGGPWVKPNQSMRYLAYADTTITGGSKVRMTLPKIKPNLTKWNGRENLPESVLAERKIAEDVKVIAYPCNESSTIADKTWNINKKKDESLVLDMPFQGARSMVIQGPGFLKGSADLYGIEGGTPRFLVKVILNRTNMRINTGFYPAAPTVISIPESSAETYRLVFDKKEDCTASVTLSVKPMEERFPEKSLAKMFPGTNPMFSDYMWPKQPEVPSDKCIAPNKVIDVTKYVKNGIIDWKAPAGNWVICRLGMLTTGVSNAPTNTPQTRGLEVDKLSKKHIASHFDAYIGEVLRRIPAVDRRTFKFVVADSYETGGQNWTDDMIDIFKERYHYDPLPYLPVLQGEVVGSPDKSDRFLWDLRRLVADKVAYDYVGGLREVSHKYGLQSWLENYGHWGFPAEFLQYGGQSDEIGGEFWTEGLGSIEVRDAASCAHIYGKPKVWAESCTASGNAFGRYPNMLKQRIDHFFTEGVNATLLHVSIEQPDDSLQPGYNAWFGTEFNRQNTWFSQMNYFTDYLRRVNLMLQQGKYVADVAYFIGEDTPKMTGVKIPDLPKGYSYDYINAEVLMQHSVVNNGRLVLDSGMEYRLLVLPPQKTMRPALLSRIAELVKQGLIIIGPSPEESPSLENYPNSDKQVKKIAKAMWGNVPTVCHRYGKGYVYGPETDLKELLAKMEIVPDFDLDGKYANSIEFIHRRTAKGDIYFISNQTEETVSFSPKFRVSGKVPEYWMPLTGDTRCLRDFTCDGVSTQVPLTLQPLESAFIVFRNDGKPSGRPMANFPEAKELQSLSNNWTVQFIATDTTVTFNTLQDWMDSSDPKIRYYSGTANYTTSFIFNGKNEDNIYLDLGNVMVMAIVKLNGKEIGGIWTAPYSLNISKYLKRGNNLLEISVVNNWKNRIIGDLLLPKNKRTTWLSVNPWKVDSPLQSSGLLGPVRILSCQY